jgi:O-antigen/teichoic acid export membrane protein
LIRRNIAANAIGRIWGILSVYLFVPLYLKFLGIEAYGLIGFYSTLFGVLAFADMGFTATVNREMARLSVQPDSADRMGRLLRTYETSYAFVSILLAILVWLLAPYLSEHWLRSSTLRADEIARAIQLMGAAIAFQLPAGLYIAGLMGLQEQVRANSLMIAWSVLRGVGAVVVLWLVSPTIIAFAWWQLLCSGVYCFSARFFLWRAVLRRKLRAQPRFEWQVFGNTWHYAAGMMSLAIVSTLLTQTDKLVISKMLPLEMLGYYTIATALASLPLALASPIALAVFPRLTGLVALNDREGLARMYHRTCELVAVATIPAALTIALFSGNFILAWTGSAVTAQRAGLVSSLLIAGQLLQALLVVPYYVALAYGNVRLNIQIGISSVLLITPLLILLIMKYGILGAGISWLVLNLCTLPAYMYLLHQKFLRGELRRWYARSFVRPMLAALPLVLIGRLLLPYPSSRFWSLSLIGLVWLVTAGATATALPELREAVFRGKWSPLEVFRAQ